MFSLTLLGINFEISKIVYFAKLLEKNFQSMWGPCSRGMYVQRQIFPIRRTVIKTV